MSSQANRDAATASPDPPGVAPYFGMRGIEMMRAGGIALVAWMLLPGPLPLLLALFGTVLFAWTRLREYSADDLAMAREWHEARARSRGPRPTWLQRLLTAIALCLVGLAAVVAVATIAGGILFKDSNAELQKLRRMHREFAQTTLLACAARKDSLTPSQLSICDTLARHAFPGTAVDEGLEHLRELDRRIEAANGEERRPAAAHGSGHGSSMPTDGRP